MKPKTMALESTSDYIALRDAAALLPRRESGVLIVRGADRIDFLQRMTTNDIGALGAGSACVTVLTSPTARILFVFTVLHQEDELLLFPCAGETEKLARYLRGQIFFMDNVTVEPWEESAYRLRLMGPNAEAILESLALIDEALQAEQWRRVDDVIVLKQAAYDIPGFELAGPSATVDALRARMQEAGATQLQEVGAYELRRIELGRPAPGAELVEEYTPLETGLGWSCSDSKGCYTGQEIIARQITYDKVTRNLVGLMGTEPMAAGGELTVAGRAAGKITSAAFHPQRGLWVALAVVKRPHHAAGTELLLNGAPVNVSPLPLPE